MPRITFIHPQGLSGEVASNTSILKAAEALGFPLPHDCGGKAKILGDVVVRVPPWKWADTDQAGTVTENTCTSQ